VHTAGRRRCGGVGLAPIWSYLMQWSRKRCTPRWGHGVTQSVPSKSS
jgi:hypothetical protein